ncbi:16S rRNA (cytidine1402-2'-O)-methyltransferase [Ekhidna lutea]|uniref:Ribosomal RNA small subunit methyltransferase I n=1 Tax=Ekhidna lutea TaxID=447679 RepID=A0A239EGP8_EKHLU|nr:16S rRNA (cytidine(1402)-2'-O)-methyltransferase [Ekhidna lutea]SNS43611.1 16S rRNA (cytidine1402-2'-O)-methyltransferase [Ekhidna lutea]
MTIEPGKLYLVPTPIGNLADMTYRAVEVLKNVDLILAEDTRTSGVLLKHYEIGTPAQSFHAHNEHKKVEEAIAKLKEGKSIAQISDAGTPGISDPGFLLVREALANEIPVDSLPGATAFIPALVKSGFPCDRFVFEGFLPHKKGRQTRIESIKEETRTVVYYESPHRLLKTLQQFKEILGERNVSVSRELTKKFEETVTGPIDDVLTYFSAKSIKGEFVIVLEGAK